MASEPSPELVEELYGAPLEDFVARRDAAAKSLRSSGDRAGADAVKKLRKPSVSAAAVNRLARDAPDEVSSLLAAGEALRQAQLGGGSDRDTIRSAAADERAAVERLVSEAGAYGLSPSSLEEVRSTLHAAALDEDLREEVRRGVLVEPRQAVGLGPFGAAVARPRPSPKGGGQDESTKGGPAGRGSDETAASSDDDRADEAAARAAAAAEKERRREAKERVKAAKAALREAEKAAKAAERERDRAAKALDKADKAATTAAEELDRRREELEAAESA
jgi:hypothetical protein